MRKVPRPSRGRLMPWVCRWSMKASPKHKVTGWKMPCGRRMFRRQAIRRDWRLIVCSRGKVQIKIGEKSDGEVPAALAGNERTARDRAGRGRGAARARHAAGAGRLLAGDTDLIPTPRYYGGCRSGMLRQGGGRPCVGTRHDIDRPEVAVVDILQRHRHHPGAAVDVDAAEKLQSETWGEIVVLPGAAALFEHGRRSEGVVEPARTPGAGVQRP